MNLEQHSFDEALKEYNSLYPTKQAEPIDEYIAIEDRYIAKLEALYEKYKHLEQNENNNEPKETNHA